MLGDAQGVPMFIRRRGAKLGKHGQSRKRGSVHDASMALAKSL
jgi:hypothetical protein